MYAFICLSILVLLDLFYNIILYVKKIRDKFLDSGLFVYCA